MDEIVGNHDLPLDMNEIVGSHDLLLVTLDTLRYDVAAELAGGRAHAHTWPARCPAGGGSGGTARGASPTPRTTRSSPASCRRRPRPARTRACSPRAFPGQRDDRRRHLRVRRARPGRGAGRGRVPHRLHRRRRLLQQADPARLGAARGCSPRATGSRRSASPRRPRSRRRSTAPSGRSRGLPGPAVPVRQRLRAAPAQPVPPAGGDPRAGDGRADATPPRWSTWTGTSAGCSPP